MHVENATDAVFKHFTWQNNVGEPLQVETAFCEAVCKNMSQAERKLLR